MGAIAEKSLTFAVRIVHLYEHLYEELLKCLTEIINSTKRGMSD